MTMRLLVHIVETASLQFGKPYIGAPHYFILAGNFFISQTQ